MSNGAVNSVKPHMFLIVPLFLYKWLVVIPMVGISTAIIASLITILSILGMPDFASRVLATFWARLNALISLMSVEVKGKEKVDWTKSYVIASNHQSLFDIYVVYGFSGFNLKWVMKAELRKVPFLGLACDKMGHIYVDRSNHQAAVTSINNARERILRGNSVVFFPEGTRSRTEEMLPFKKGAFRMAIDLGLPVLPMYITGTSNCLPSDSMRWHPGHASMTFLEPISTEGMTLDDVTTLSNMTRAAIEAAQEHTSE